MQLITQNQSVWGSFLIKHVTSIRLGGVVGLQRNSFSLFSVSNIIVLLSRYLALYHSFTLFRNFTSCAQGVIILWVVNCHFLPRAEAAPPREQTKNFFPARGITAKKHKRDWNLKDIEQHKLLCVQVSQVSNWAPSLFLAGKSNNCKNRTGTMIHGMHKWMETQKRHGQHFWWLTVNS